MRQAGSRPRQYSPSTVLAANSVRNRETPPTPDRAHRGNHDTCSPLLAEEQTNVRGYQAPPSRPIAFHGYQPCSLPLTPSVSAARVPRLTPSPRTTAPDISHCDVRLGASPVRNRKIFRLRENSDDPQTSDAMTPCPPTRMTTNPAVQSILHSLAGAIPTTFTGDRAQAQQFLDEFWQLERANLRHILITHPALRIELALSFIHGPLTDPWRQTVQRGSPDDTKDEELWDEFYDSFCTAWTDNLPVPVPQTPSPPAPVNAPAAQRAEECQVVTTPDETLFAPRTAAPTPRQNTPPTITNDNAVVSTTTAMPILNAEDDFDFEEFYLGYLDNNTSIFSPHAPTPTPPPSIFDLVRPVEEPVHLSMPATPTVQRVEKRKQHDTSDEEETRPSKHPRIAPRTGPPRTRPQLARRSVPLPRRYAFAPRRATSAPITSAPSFIVPYLPPPRRPPSPPGDPTQATLDSGGRRTIVEDDNTLTRGVKTLDDSVFAPVSAQDAMDSLPQTLPHAHLFPCHSFERPRDPDELATRTTNRQNRGNTRPPYPTTSHNYARHAQQNRPTASPADSPPTPVTSRPVRRQCRATAAASSTSPLPSSVTTRNHNRHAHIEQRRHEHRRHPPSPVTVRNDSRPARQTIHPAPHHAPRNPMANKATDHEWPPDTLTKRRAVEAFLDKYDTVWAIQEPTPTKVERPDDIITQYLDHWLGYDDHGRHFISQTTRPTVLQHASMAPWWNSRPISIRQHNTENAHRIDTPHPDRHV
ncbi:hypothetical protein EDB83DRAFT_2587822 [Lactarius deliciosus]|nr:hypothetical protein EDB83DRAFT_2587822 [Lactarius deliciosus]